ncbi:unnamed protein product [Prunus armeniaca]
MLLGESPKKKKKTKKYFPNPSRPNLTITSLPSSPSTAAPVPSSSNHQPPTTGYGDHSSSFISLPCSRSRFFSLKHPQNWKPDQFLVGFAVLCLNLFALAVFCSGLRMEASQSNTLNASISTPSIKLETQAQPQTQPQDQQINSVNGLQLLQRGNAG